MKYLLMIVLISMNGCGSDSAENIIPSPTENVQPKVFQLANSYNIIHTNTNAYMQIEDLLNKPLGLVHYDQVVHHGSFACIVDFYVYKVGGDPNVYSLHVEQTAKSSTNISYCSEIYGTYWMTLTSDTEASLMNIMGP